MTFRQKASRESYAQLYLFVHSSTKTEPSATVRQRKRATLYSYPRFRQILTDNHVRFSTKVLIKSSLKITSTVQSRYLVLLTKKTMERLVQKTRKWTNICITLYFELLNITLSGMLCCLLLPYRDHWMVETLLSTMCT